VQQPVPTPLDGLVPLCHHRWTIPLIAELGPSGGRFAVLGKRLDVARQTLRRALDAAIEAHLVEANPGYGHPLRPEYRLTAQGARLVEPCRAVHRACAVAPDVTAKKWTLPVLVAVHEGASRFSTVQRALQTVSPRALSRSLDDLTDAVLLEREHKGRSRLHYRVHPQARSLAQRAEQLAFAASANP
jgi:DNA-binding HxlR family transcriptional regulator